MSKARFFQNPDVIDYTPVSAVSAGSVVTLASGLAGITKVDIAAGQLGAVARTGLFWGQKAAVALSAGDLLGWDADGDPVTGDAGTGAFTNVVASMDTVIGTVVTDAAETADEVLFILNVFANAKILESIPAIAHIADVAAVTAAAVELTASDPSCDANDITDSTGGTPSGTHELVDCGTDTWDNEKGDVENNFSTLAAEYNGLKDDVEAIETSLELAIDDLGLQKAELDKLIADVTADKTKINAVLLALETAGVVASA